MFKVGDRVKKDDKIYKIIERFYMEGLNNKNEIVRICNYGIKSEDKIEAINDRQLIDTIMYENISEIYNEYLTVNPLERTRIIDNLLQKNINEYNKMFKYNIKEKVIYNKGKCEVITREYYECLNNDNIEKHKFYTIMDICGQTYCCNEEELNPMKNKRIDIIMASEDPSKELAKLFAGDKGCKDFCINYDEYDDCEENCEEGIKEFLDEEIEPTLNETCESIEKIIQQAEKDIVKHEEILKEIKEQQSDKPKDFMEVYKDVVDEVSSLCIKKNKDYGSSVVDTYDKFGDISYLTRITDKYNRLVSLHQHQDSCEVSDEKYDDTIRDLANYCLLWLANRKYNK